MTYGTQTKTYGVVTPKPAATKRASTKDKAKPAAKPTPPGVDTPASALEPGATIVTTTPPEETEPAPEAVEEVVKMTDDELTQLGYRIGVPAREIVGVEKKGDVILVSAGGITYALAPDKPATIYDAPAAFKHTALPAAPVGPFGDRPE